MPVIPINAKNFIAGESSADYVSDKGFSPSSYAVNLTKKRGVLHFGNTVTDRSGAVLTGNIIASADDRNYLGNDKYLLDDEGAFYTLSGSTLTKRQDSASTFIQGTSDLVQFNLVTYATSTDSLHELTGADLATCERLWGASLDASFRHPLEIVEDEMFVANKNVIYYLNNSGTTGTAFTLPTQVNVTSLRKHTDGRTLIAFCGTTGDLNGAHTRPGIGKAYLCDPILRDWIKEIDLEEQVEGSKTVGGVIYVTYGNRVGYFNGEGVSFLKQLDTSSVTYSHNLSNWNDILLVRDGFGIKAFGDLGAGRVWWSMYNNQESTTSKHLNFISAKGSNLILTGYAPSAGAGLLYEIDPGGDSQAGIFYSNRIDFGQEVNIKRIDIIHDQTNSVGITAFSVWYRDTNDTETFIERPSYSSMSASRTRIQTHITTDIFQLKLTQDNDIIGFKAIRIYYEPIK